MGSGPDSLRRFASLPRSARTPLGLPVRFATLHLRPPPREMDVAALDWTMEIEADAMGTETNDVALEKGEAAAICATTAAGLDDDLQRSGNLPLSFAQENYDWSLLPAPTPPTSPTLTAEGPSTPTRHSSVAIFQMK
ncbi:hypothetical protein BS78_10G062500 [Paspalum vaginatum]|nr:hypothetical protein BS78_10G062500 [Paspalum vaginatum]